MTKPHLSKHYRPAKSKRKQADSFDTVIAKRSTSVGYDVFLPASRASRTLVSISGYGIAVPNSTEESKAASYIELPRLHLAGLQAPPPAEDRGHPAVSVSL